MSHPSPSILRTWYFVHRIDRSPLRGNYSLGASHWSVAFKSPTDDTSGIHTGTVPNTTTKDRPSLFSGGNPSSLSFFFFLLFSFCSFSKSGWSTYYTRTMQRSDPDTPTFGVCMYWKRGVIPRVTVCWWDGVDILVCTLTLFMLLFTPNLSIYLYLRRTDYYDIRPEHMQEARSHSISRISSVLRDIYIFTLNYSNHRADHPASRTDTLSTSLRTE